MTTALITTPGGIDCATAVRRLWDYLDGELDDARMAEVDAHLDACRRCPPHFAFARTFLDALAAGRREHAPPVALRDRVVAALVAEGFTGGPR
jgi:anti-sigma factor (TIGR02949 family)